jgi:transposase
MLVRAALTTGFRPMGLSARFWTSRFEIAVVMAPVSMIHTADIQDRDGALLLLAAIIRRVPWLRHLFADGGYAGDKLREALCRIGRWSIEIIKRSDAAKGFEVLPRRWVVERTLAWLSRNRRLAKDFEQTIESATAWLFVASVQLFTRSIARLCE